MFAWLRRRRRRALLARPFPPDWLAVLQGLPFYGRLDARGQARLRDDLRVLIAEKEWEGCGGLQLTDAMRVTIAAQASLLILAVEHDYYRNVDSILVYPSGYRSAPYSDRSGVVHEGPGNLGEAWQRGPVVIAWDAVRDGVANDHDGRNLVLREFAHKLDQLDGLADGTRPLGSSAAMAAWVRIMTREFQELRAAADDGRATLLDRYGATNPAEFFAVATECFFERGAELRERHRELYGVLCEYYGQDPAGRERA